MRQVLIIDDDRMLRRELSHVLTRQGYAVIEAAEPKKGIEQARQHQPDLILLDVLMPGMDGVSVLRQLRADEDTSEIPVIMVTSLGAEDQIAACMEEGAIDHITKPVPHRLLCARIAATLMKQTMGEITERHSAESGLRHVSQTIAVIGAKGGVGTTTVAANLASAAATAGQSTILCEMRTLSGTLGLQLHANPRHHLGTIMVGDAISGEPDWDEILVRDSSGLRILFGPQIIDGDIELSSTKARKIIDSLRSRCRLVFLDLAAGLSQLNSEILKASDRVILVTDCEPTSVLAARGILEQLQNWSLRRSIMAAIVKRTELAMPPKLDEIQKLLDCGTIGVVPPAADSLSNAVKSGAILERLEPDCLLSTTIRQMAQDNLLLEVSGEVQLC